MITGLLTPGSTTKSQVGKWDSHYASGSFTIVDTQTLDSYTGTVNQGAHFIPDANDSYDHGSDAYIIRDIYLGGIRHGLGAGSSCGVDLAMTGAGYTSQINLTGTDYTHVLIQAGAGVASSKTGRNATIKGGAPYTITGSATGGSVYLTGANGNGTSGVGGSIIMTPGTGTAASGVAEVVGKFGVRDPGSAYYTYISSPILSSDMTYVMPSSMPPASGYVLGSTGGTNLGWISQSSAGGNEPISFQQVVGTTDINTSSASFVDMTDMSVSIAGAGTYLMIFSSTIYFPMYSDPLLVFDVDGTNYGGMKVYNDNHAEHGMGTRMVSEQYAVTLTGTGTHTFKVQWKAVSGTIYNNASTESSKRILTVIKLSSTSTDSPVGSVLQTVYHQRQDEVVCSTTIAADNNARTSSDGTEILTKKITPSSNSNILKITVSINSGGTNASQPCLILLDGTTVLATSRGSYFGMGGDVAPQTLIYFMTSPGTSEKTISVRYGAGASTTLNAGVNAASMDNGKLISTLVIEEIKG